MQGILDDSELDLQVVATGMHLSPEFGLTFRPIEQDGFRIDRKVEVLLSSDTSVGIAKSMGLGLIGFADAFNELRPDVLVVLGDRFEIFSAVAAALVAKIPVAHIHGGELTEGAFDDAFRHSITKMSHLHFVAAKAYERRVIQLGEVPDSVFLVGGLGIDSIKRLRLLDRAEIESELGIRFLEKNLLVTFHPVTLSCGNSSLAQMEELLAALADLKNTQLIFTLPNADSDGRTLAEMVRRFAAERTYAHVFTSLGQLRYLSCVAQVDGVVGNSSSGLIEVPSLRKGTINIGDRQFGRLQAASIINCEPTRVSISDALQRLYSDDFKISLPEVFNPYGDGGASEKIVAVLKHADLENLVRKSFHDLSVPD